MRIKTCLPLMGIVMFAVAACAGPAPEPEASRVKRVEVAMANDDAQEMIMVFTAVDKFEPLTGFEEKAKVLYGNEQVIGALVSGEAWVGHDSTSRLWAAMDEGSVDLVMVAIDKDGQASILGTRPGITSVDDLVPGTTFGAGSIGDYDEVELRKLMEAIGVDAEEMNIVAMDSADNRMRAMLAGQLDAGVQQPRNIGPLEDAGGAILFDEAFDVPQEVFVVLREFLESNRADVCAFVTARIQSKQWAYEGSDHKENLAAGIEIGMANGIEATEYELADWVRELEGNHSLDLGATVEALDEFEEVLRTLGRLSEEFDWRNHADFSCVWEAQETLGLDQRPADY